MGADGGQVGVRTQEYAVIPAAHIKKLSAHMWDRSGSIPSECHAAQRFKPEPGEPAMAGLAAGELVFAVPGQRYNPHAEVVKAVYIGVYAVERRRLPTASSAAARPDAMAELSSDALRQRRIAPAYADRF